ncbi:bicarbonate ABC-type transporter, ATPase component TauB-like protein [Psychroflexus torquis ATCC 700755]|jgi:ABC-type nitrate/sulfonate/bicarbonate transport system ATPase subunit|uniref:Bicarbonate ABC-type transporter, ATPase component TauB-like protein n=1 Tax=Psychroflexus torquis (strain ATCC 700755 / CIP 106069 / ACAM 623) TaxID=313595 RepID=K4ITV3_PSYTT|nr:ABC transporter ATP-binding protein [Psychroflexus torquis]AFU68915.1 bicarbonate ABC-type transporter, ATPase component TauB-like protein [Psychroflexus torquis ATCC 700755]
MVELKNINVQFDTLKVLSDINLVIKKSEITSILGPSGSGKTTMLRCIAGLNKNFKGEILINNQDQSTYFNEHRIAVVNQGYSSFPWLSVKENILVAKKRNTNNTLNVGEIIEAIGLNGFEDYYPNQLSGGMQQRVAIGRAILQDTDILVFDEPFGALDYQTRLQLQLLIKRIKNDFGKTIIFVTHDIEEAIFISDKVVVLSKTPSIIVDEIVIDEEINTALDNKVRYIPEFIGLRSKIENIINSLSDQKKISEIFKNINNKYVELKILDFWNTFLMNECRKQYEILDKETQTNISLKLLNSDEKEEIIVGSLLHASIESEEIKSKLTDLLFKQNNNEVLNYYLIHSLTNLQLDSILKNDIKSLVYNNIEEFVSFEKRYLTLDGTLNTEVVLKILNSRFEGNYGVVDINNKGWLLLISSLAHSNTDETLKFLSKFVNDEDTLTKETALELIQKIENNEIDFGKIRQKIKE